MASDELSIVCRQSLLRPCEPYKHAAFFVREVAEHLPKVLHVRIMRGHTDAVDGMSLEQVDIDFSVAHHQHTQLLPRHDVEQLQ